jgi:hypothetical protein
LATLIHIKNTNAPATDGEKRATRDLKKVDAGTAE